MNVLNPASGDCNEVVTAVKEILQPEHETPNDDKVEVGDLAEIVTELGDTEDVKEECTQQTSETDNSLKERIKQCRTIIESLKAELNQEKARLEKESKVPQKIIDNSKITDFDSSLDPTCSPDFYSSCVENKLTCDENLIQYERQLQRYQNTLHMAQVEKKNAIRKQMIAKAYKLKLLEVENQCNIELLRVKQSLQCLAPLQMIANKWKTSTDEYTYDLNSFELMPRYPELSALSGSDVSSVSDTDNKNKSAITPD